MTSPVNDAGITPTLVETISSQIPDLSPDQVDAVLSTWRTVLSGDPVGTVRRSDSGAVAHRVAVDGIFLWRVTEPDGAQYNDMAPSLSWPAVWEVSQ